MKDQPQSPHRVGSVSSEMLRRAMQDAHAESARRNGAASSDRGRTGAAQSPNAMPAFREGARSRSGNSQRREQPDLWQQDAERSRTGAERNPAGAAANRAGTPWPNPERETVEVVPWHQLLIERFFAPPPAKDPLTQNGRLYFLLTLFLLACLAVTAKLFKIQVLDHNAFSSIAQHQYRTPEPIAARRGVIRDRNGVILAANTYVVKFAVDPTSIQNKQHLAELFSRTFHKPVKEYLTAFADTSRHYIVIEKEVPQEVATTLDSVNDRGLIREKDSRRQYAFDRRASHIIGFTSRDARGLAGIELFANRDLSGQAGFQIMERDGRGIKRPDVDYETVPPKDGSDVTLTIDETIQSFTENALTAGVAKANAEAGIAIVMCPKTGEILALANAPDFDPNAFGKASNDDLRDRAVTDAFEPGSIIKVITAAAALQEGAMKPDDKIYAEGGRWTSDGATFIDTHEYGWLTFRGALEKSSNICFAKISDKLDRRRFYKYLRDFGLGVVSGIDLPGEIRGYVRKPDVWGTNSKRYMAFGYELTATPLQMAVAYSTIANMGVMMKPYVIAKRTTADGTDIVTNPQEIRRVVSEQTARTLIDMMRGVVDSGTATTARIKGITVAGKTGTAQQLVNGHYSKEHYTSSFAGFFPAENPEYMILVMLRSPKNGYYGGAVSAPIWREIAVQLLELAGKLPPEAREKPVTTQPLVDEGGPIVIDGTLVRAPEKQTERQMPEVRGLTAEAARTLLASQGFRANVVDEDGIIERADRVSSDSVRLVLQRNAAVTDAAKDDAVKIRIPDFAKLPMARAMKFAALSGVRTKLVGQGIVNRQFPEAGTSVERNSVVTLFGDE